MTDGPTNTDELAADAVGAEAQPDSITADEQEAWREEDRRRIQRTRRTLVVILVILVILLMIACWALYRIFQPPGKVASQEEAKGITWVRSIYGWGKKSDQQFWGPQGVGIGTGGTVWVTTQGQNRVVGFNPDGSLAAMLFQGPAGDKQYPNALTYPVAVDEGPDGLIYIADQPRSTVWVLSRDNRIVRSIFVPTPASVTVSKDRLVVGSASGFVIMTPTGQVIKVLGSQGKAEDQFEAVRGAAISKDGSTIYVADQYNNRVSAYDKNGNRKWLVSTGNPGNKKAHRVEHGRHSVQGPRQHADSRRYDARRQRSHRHRRSVRLRFHHPGSRRRPPHRQVRCSRHQRRPVRVPERHRLRPRA